MNTTDRFRPFAAIYLVLIKNNQVLLLRRFQTNYGNGHYSMVSGHIDGGETIRQSTIREAKEEAGIDIDPQDLEIVHLMHRMNKLCDREYLDAYVRASKWSGEITNMEPHKCDELKWFDLDNLPDNILPEVKFAIESIQKNIHYSEFGW